MSRDARAREVAAADCAPAASNRPRAKEFGGPFLAGAPAGATRARTIAPPGPVLLLLLFSRLFVSLFLAPLSQPINCLNIQEQTRLSSQHELTKYYHEVRQNEIYKRHDVSRQAAPASAQAISLRQALVPLFGVGHSPSSLSRKDSTRRRGEPSEIAKLFDYKSSNNRGPANAVVDQLVRAGPARPRNQLAPGHPNSSMLFGQRRRHDGLMSARSILGGQANHFARGEREHLDPDKLSKKSGAWSQPDPRRSYSLPISLIAAAASDGARSPGARRINSSGTGAAGVPSALSSPHSSKRRNEPDSLLRFAQSIEQNVSSSTQPTAADGSAFGGSSGDSDAGAVPDQRQHPEMATLSRQQKSLDASGAQIQQQQSQIVFGGRNGINGMSPASGQRQKAPMVTLIRYVPLVVNVPAEQVAVIAPPQTRPTNQAAEVSLGSSPLDQIYRHHDGADQSDSNKHRALSASKYHIIDSLLPNAGETTKHQAVAPSQLLVEHAASDINSEYAQLYPSNGALHLDGQPTLIANGHQLTRLAYVPVGQPQLTVPSSHATSKALSAYASKLISMLRPSTLFSSIGAAPSHGQHGAGLQQTLPHIYLLAPAEPVAPSSRTTSRPAVATYQMAATTNQQRPEDTLMNQASKVHSTKSQGQPSSSVQQQSMRWPLSPQMNGLVCIQGVINTKSPTRQPQPQQQQPLSQNQMQEEDFGSFDYDRPQQFVESKSAGRQKHQQSGGKTSMPTKSSGKGHHQRRKESPIRLMQKMANSKRGAQASDSARHPTGNFDGDQIEQQQMPMPQQKLLLSSSSDSNSIVDTRRLESRRQPTHNFDQQRESAEKGSSMIPFTIRDKIDAPVGNRARPFRPNWQPEPLTTTTAATAATTTTSIGTTTTTTTAAPHASAHTVEPVQYDEPSEMDLNLASQADLDQRRSRTNFVSSSPSSIGSNYRSMRQPRPQAISRNLQYSNQIDYRREAQAPAANAPLNSQRNDFSVPVLMASSSVAHALNRNTNNLSELAARNDFARPSGRDDDPRHTTTPAMSFARHSGQKHTPSPAPPLRQPFVGIQSASMSGSHELLGSPSSSSSVSTTTTTTTTSSSSSTSLSTPTDSVPTSADSQQFPFTSSSVPPPTLMRHSNRRHDNLGQLISSISLVHDQADDNDHDESRMASQSERTTNSSTSLAATKANSSSNDTIELVVNSTPREAQTTTATSRTAPSSPLDQDYFVTQNITASPLHQLFDHSQTTTTMRPQLERALLESSEDDERSQSDLLASTNTFSHDRTLSSLSAGNSAGQFGRISESLQTNPLDLIDLQNSRSSFELPAHLESLSMLYASSDNYQQQQEVAAGLINDKSGRQQQQRASTSEQLSQSESSRNEKQERLAPPRQAGRPSNHRHAPRAAGASSRKS